MTMLVVSHELRFAREAADRIVFIDQGRIVEEGPPSAILIAPRNSINYYNSVVSKVRKADESMRLYMAPGMGHCAGGDGPSSFDMVAPIADWVEQGKAPDRIIARSSSLVIDLSGRCVLGVALGAGGRGVIAGRFVLAAATCGSGGPLRGAAGPVSRRAASPAPFTRRRITAARTRRS